MRIALFISLLFGFSSVLGCDIDDRCGDDYELIDRVCEPIADTSSDTSTETEPADDAGSDDAGTDDTGLGMDCTSDGNECAGQDADYCAMKPTSDVGYCTHENCMTDPDDCPDGYQCCSLPSGAGGAKFCSTDADYAAMGAMCQS